MSLGKATKSLSSRKLGRKASKGKNSVAAESVDELNKIRDSLRDYIVDKDEDGCVKAMQYLHKKNYLAVSDLEEKDGSGKSLLYWACYLEQLAIVAALLEYGATPTHVEVHAALSGKYGKKTTACLALLLKTLKLKGAEALSSAINTKSNDWDGAALHVALSRGEKKDMDGLTKRVAMLLEAKSDITSTVQKGTSPLHICAENGWFELAKTLLLHAGAKSEFAAMLDSKGRPAHVVAKDRGHSELASYLERRETADLPDPPEASDVKRFLLSSESGSTEEMSAQRIFTHSHTSLSSPIPKRSTAEYDITFSPLSRGLPSGSVVEATMAVLADSSDRAEAGGYDAFDLPSPSASPRVDRGSDQRQEEDDLPVVGAARSLTESGKLVDLFLQAESETADGEAPDEPPTTISDFLAGLGLGKYIEVCLEEDIDLVALKLLDDADMKELGLGLGARRKIQKALKGE